MSLKIIVVFFLLTFFGCKSHRDDFYGTWIPEIGMFPTLEIKESSIIISSQSNIREFSYTIKNNQIILNDSVGDWFGFPENKGKETFIVKRIAGDSLILSYNDFSYDFLLIKKRLTNYQKFSNITLVYSNGWDRTLEIEIDSSGKMNMKEENLSNIKRFGNAVLKPEVYKGLLETLNYLYSCDKFKRSGSCSDCETYGLSLYRNDSVKSFFVDNSSIHSIISKAILSILSKEYETNLKPSDTMERIHFPKFFGCDTIIFERIGANNLF